MVRTKHFPRASTPTEAGQTTPASPLTRGNVEEGSPSSGSPLSLSLSHTHTHFIFFIIFLS
ncbi:hypothetical protein QJS04_geneDACA003307 [Acorus gramineus]|uniref:Uncharacterized protein n=1 Tax=Acorus gramineus TaxID=55184 RepID=A0AAV9BM66_ACOGR|nr:hypothetical protein QJS04_geneDACA003307 [Acorus gramineus]